MSELINNILKEAGIGVGNVHSVLDIGKGKPIAVYNANEKKILGIFASQLLAGKFIFKDNNPQKNMRMVNDRAKRKALIDNSLTNTGCDIAVRYANPEQIKQLDNQKYLTFNGAEVSNNFATQVKFKYDNPKDSDSEEQERKKRQVGAANQGRREQAAIARHQAKLIK